MSSSFVKTPTGVVMHTHNHQRAVELAKKNGNKGWLEMLEPATPVEAMTFEKGGRSHA